MFKYYLVVLYNNILTFPIIILMKKIDIITTFFNFKNSILKFYDIDKSK